MLLGNSTRNYLAWTT